MSRQDKEVIPQPLSEIIALYADVLADVAFPDVDAASLEAGAEVVRGLETELAALEAQVTERRAALRAALGQLEVQARRGLAYARIYAEGDEALGRRIAELRLAAPKPEAAPAARRGRRRRASEGGGQPLLPVEATT